MFVDDAREAVSNVAAIAAAAFGDVVVDERLQFRRLVPGEKRSNAGRRVATGVD